MSGPYSFTVTVISGQKDSSLLVCGASAFLYRGWMSIHPISTNKNVKEELYLCLDVFSRRGCFVQQPDIYHAKHFAERIDTDFTDQSISGSLFWIALDEQGYSLAREFLTQKRVLPEEKVYKSVRKLNLVEQPMPLYPETQVPPQFWQEVLRKLYEKDVPMTILEKEFYAWYKLLHDNLVSWRNTIGNIQSDWS